MRRSLRYPLAPHDQLFLLHIPKTGGTTLFDILKTYFAPEDVFSFRLPDLDNAEALERLATARLIRGHVGYKVYRLLARQPVYLTMLRHPVDRVISSYAAARRMTKERPQPFEGSLEEFLADQTQGNNQTYAIAGDQHEIRRAALETILGVAKAHLQSFPFFGITERFDDSLRLLIYILGWEYPKAYEPQNVSSAKEKPEITPAVRELILERNPLDLALYDFAKALFEERFQTMNSELSL